MRFIAPLVAGARPRDVLVNVMFDHINRFKDDPRGLPSGADEGLLGLGETEMPEGLDEEQLFALSTGPSSTGLCGHFLHAADLAIPHPTMDRTTSSAS